MKLPAISKSILKLAAYGIVTTLVALGGLTACSGGSAGGGSSGGGGTPAPTLYTLGGSVTGLNTGSQVQFIVTINNASNSSPTTATITATVNGTFTSQPVVPAGGNFVLLVSSQPVGGQICTASNNSGTGVKANVANISVVCSATTFAVGGTVSGLLTGQSVTLLLNGDTGHPAVVNANGPYQFTATPVAQGSNYTATVEFSPFMSTCVLSNASATNVQAVATNVNVSCSQAETIVHSFSGGPSDGVDPEFALVEMNGVLYGSTSLGGAFGSSTGLGTVFAFPIASGGSYSLLHSFSGSTTDGACPQSALTVGANGTTLYGATCHGGAVNGANSGDGTVYSITPAGTESLLYSFGSTTGDGTNPYGALVQVADGTFYGTTAYGGTGGYGTIFHVDASGNETVMYSFGATVAHDGLHPHATMILGSDGQHLYGTTYSGGTCATGSAGGTVFSYTIGSTTAPTILYSFGCGQDGNMYVANFTGTQTDPAAQLLEVNGYLYGTTPTGGTYNKGILFKIPLSTPSSVESASYSFGATSQDPANPQAGLIKATSDGMFYGTTVLGGTSNLGTIYRYDPAGNTVTVMHSFAGAPNDGANPYAPLTQGSDGHAYGTTELGGTDNVGTIFQF